MKVHQDEHPHGVRPPLRYVPPLASALTGPPPKKVLAQSNKTQGVPSLQGSAGASASSSSSVRPPAKVENKRQALSTIAGTLRLDRDKSCLLYTSDAADDM
eukprot:8353182-Karenia_brevis.AAC.1